MKSSKSSGNRIIRWLRVIHRDLGFLMVGVSLIYGISGLLLNHMDGQDPAYKSTYGTLELPKDLDTKALAAAWNGESGRPEVKIVMPVDETHLRLMLDGGVGVYNSATGILDYEIHKKRPFVYWINKLHYNKVGGWSWMADFFAVSLVFFAISGLLMVRGRRGLKGSGKWYLAAGIIIPVIYILVN